MGQFNVGDKVRRKPEFRTEGGWSFGGQLLTVTQVEGAWIETDESLGSGFAHRFDLVEAAPTAPVVEHTSRANDPATSVAAGKVKRTSLREKVWVAMTTTAFVGNGLTGHELAKVVDAPLNSVTPRLAELRRAEKIKDSGQRRDKQIVWVLA